MTNYFNNDMASLFVQLAGPNSVQNWLGCHDMGDLAEPQGDVSRTFCPDPSGRGKWVITSRTQGAPGEIIVDLTFPLGKTADWLEMIKKRRCPVSLYANWAECGQRNWPDNFDRGLVLENAILTSKGYSNPAMAGRDGAAPSATTRTFSFSAAVLEEYFDLVATRRAVAATTAMLAIRACSAEQCLGACGAPSYLGQVLYATDTAAAAKSVVYRSADSGVTWAAVGGAIPFAVDENAGSIQCFPISPTATRLLLFRTETTAATPAQVCYSDDNGTTWSAAISVGATNTEFFPYAQSSFAFNREHIWACTDTGAGASGSIYFSSDGGVTWATQFTGAADSLNVIHFADEKNGVAYGNTGQVYTTNDGGAHWTAKTVIAAVSIRGGLCLDAHRLWACSSAGVMYYSQDGGATWATRAVPVPAGATAIAAFGSMDYQDDHILAAAGQATVGGNPYGAIFRSWDGGMNWQSWLSPAQTGAGGCTDIDLIDTNNIFAAGAVCAATGLILQAAMS